MPISTTYAGNTAPSWDVVEAFETRLIKGLSDPALGTGAKAAKGYVKWVAEDREDGIALHGRDGILLVLGDAQPYAKDGAGRAGQRVRRVIQVWVVTRNNQDRAGDARIALEKHTALEDLVIDSVPDVIPDGFAAGQQNDVGIRVTWIPGGDEIKKKTRIAPDTFVSVHLFEVIYTQRMRVKRETF